MGKHKRKKRNSAIRTKGIVKYGGDKFVVLVITIVLMVPCFIALFHAEYLLSAAFFLIASPMIIFTFFLFRFCVRYDAAKRQIEYRKLFKFRTINFDDIERVYKKSDTRTSFLIIKANGHKVGMNTLSCDGTRELQLLLKNRLPKKCEFLRSVK